MELKPALFQKNRTMNLTPFIGLLLIFITGAGLNGSTFLGLYNQLNVIGRNAIIALPAVGMTMVILTGGIDLSVGSMVSLGSVLCAMLLMGRGWTRASSLLVPVVLILAALLAYQLLQRLLAEKIKPLLRRILGAAAGLPAAVICYYLLQPLVINGFSTIGVLLTVPLLGLGIGSLAGLIIAKGKIQPFVVTLGMMSAVLGLSKTIAGKGGQIHPVYFDALDNISATATPGFELLNSKISVFGQELIPVTALFFLAAVLLVWVLLTRFRVGRYVYAIGGNEQAARLSGVRVSRIKIIVYAFCGWLSALAGVLYCSAYAQGKPDAGSTWELDAIAAVVIGGTTLSGGKGSIRGTFVGVLILGYLGNILNLQEVPSEVQDILKGVIILAAVLLQQGGFKKFLNLRRHSNAEGAEGFNKWLANITMAEKKE